MHRLTIPVSAAAVLSLAAGGSACAAPAYDWTGFYIGGHAGWENSKSNFEGLTEEVQRYSGVNVVGDDTHDPRGVVTIGSTTATFLPGDGDASSALGGGQIGYAYQTGPWVMGVEADMETDSHQAFSRTVADLPATTLEHASTITIERSTRIGRRWSLRARAGYAFDRLQVYATGGLAGAKVNVYGLDTYVNPGGAALPVTLPAPSTCCVTVVTGAVTNTTSGRARDARLGWTLGGGVEWAIFDHLSVGLEYRHSDYIHRTFELDTVDVSVSKPTITAPIGSVISAATPPRGILSATEAHAQTDAVTARINIRF